MKDDILDELRDLVLHSVTNYSPWQAIIYLRHSGNGLFDCVLAIRYTMISQKRRSEMRKSCVEILTNCKRVKMCDVKFFDVSKPLPIMPSEKYPYQIVVYSKANSSDTRNYEGWVFNWLHKWMHFAVVQGNRWMAAMNESPEKESTFHRWSAYELCERAFVIIAIDRAVKLLQLAAKIDCAFKEYLNMLGDIETLRRIKDVRDMLEHADKYMLGTGGIGEKKVEYQNLFDKIDPRWLSDNFGTITVGELDLKRLLQNIEQITPAIDLRITQLTGNNMIARDGRYYPGT